MLVLSRKRLAPTEDAETRSRLAFFGRSGHLAVMSEFLHRRINVIGLSGYSATVS
jgi:hypothetical protein